MAPVADAIIWLLWIARLGSRLPRLRLCGQFWLRIRGRVRGVKILGRLVLALSIVSSMLLMPGAAQAADDAPKPEYLYVFDGRGAKMTPVAGKPGTFDFTMPIGAGDRVVTWFTDRPVRDAGHMSMKTFVEWWASDEPDSFKVDPPNVAISSGRRTMIATMSDASLRTSKTGGDELRATMTMIPGKAAKAIAQGDSHLGSHAKRAGDNAHQGTWRMPTVSVFVDLTMTKSASQY